jgi:hypothetical protein
MTHTYELTIHRIAELRNTSQGKLSTERRCSLWTYVTYGFAQKANNPPTRGQKSVFEKAGFFMIKTRKEKGSPRTTYRNYAPTAPLMRKAIFFLRRLDALGGVVALKVLF